jgi:hypothetical protein
MWIYCPGVNPSRIYIRVNKVIFDPKRDQTGVDYLPIELSRNGVPTWKTSSDDNVDVAVLNLPAILNFAKYDAQPINYRNFGKLDESAKLTIGSQIASAGFVPGYAGEKRNYPVFKFGKIASIPDELIPARCAPNFPPKLLRLWLIGVNLVPGTSGSPILF